MSQAVESDLEQESPKFGRPWRVVGTAAAIFILSQVLAGVIVALLTLNHGRTGLQDLLNGSAPVQFAYTAIAETLAVSLVLWRLKRLKLTPAAIGLTKPKLRDVIRALLGFGVFYILLIGVSAVLFHFFPQIDTSQQQDVGFKNLVGPFDTGLALVSLVILPPLGEEVLMRGYLFSGLRSRLGFISAGLITSLLFGLAHLGEGVGGALLWTAALDTFLLSLVLVYLREKTGAIWAGIFVHALNNLVAFVVHFHN